MARTDFGNGPPCPEVAPYGHGHGKLYVLGNRSRLWCPVTQAVFGPAVFDETAREFVAGPMLRPGDVKLRKATVDDGDSLAVGLPPIDITEDF